MTPANPLLPPHRWSWRHAAATGAGAAVTGALLLLGAPAASAHDALVSTDPADGSTLPRAPAAVHLVFEEPPLEIGARVVVTGPAGVVSTGAPQLHQDTVDQAVGDALPAGRYTVDWRVTSDDGHPVDGRTSFTVTGAAASSPASTTPAVPTASGSSPVAGTGSGAASPGAGGAHRTTTGDPAGSSVLPWAGAAVAALAAASGLLARRRRTAASTGARAPRA